MALLVTTILADTVEAMKARALQALDRGSDAVELRLDALKEDCVDGIADHLPSGRWIATCRPSAEGGLFRGSIEQRLHRLLTAGTPGEGFLDFEYAEWQRSGTARHDLSRAIHDSAGGTLSRSLILSHHEFDRRPDNLDALVAGICAVEAATAVKIAWPADGICSNFEALEIMRSCPKPAVAICMGEGGLMSRLLAAKCGALAGYCALESGAEAAPGQLTLAEMKDTYRWDAIGETTQVYGVIGHPVAHSLSPVIFNDAFNRGRVDGVYLPLLVEPTYEAFAAFIDGCLAREWLDVRGFSVTLPHKLHAIRYLQDRVDPPADQIGAVNTIVINDGEVWGCNTDWTAALAALTGGLGCGWEDLADIPVDVLGAGGVARAVVAGLTECGCKVTVYNRSAERARELADSFDCPCRSWDDRIDYQGKILVNCTSLGMWPEVDASPMPAEALRPDTTVFDTVYRPAQTRLLADADRVGCPTIDGVTMFVHQAAAQFEYWTQQTAELQSMRTLVEKALSDSAME